MFCRLFINGIFINYWYLIDFGDKYANIQYFIIQITVLLCTIILMFLYLEQPGVPERLSREREELLHSSRLLPHHQLLGGRCQVQGGDDVGVIRQLCADGLTVQLLHAVHNQLPLTLRLGLLHCSPQGDET